MLDRWVDPSGVSQNGEAYEYLYSIDMLYGSIMPHVGKSTMPVGFGTWGAGLDRLALGNR